MLPPKDIMTSDPSAHAYPGRTEVEEALSRVRPYIRRTPLIRAPGLSSALDRPVWLKHEQLQETGSFKLRGAAAFLEWLASEEPGIRGVVACSSGNHGRAVAWMARALGIDATLCVPRWVDPVKLNAMEATGATVLRIGDRYEDAESEAMRLARDEDLRFVPPFDDPRIIAGQGTVAMEVLSQLENEQSPGTREPGDLLVSLSGGGLAAGCVAALEGSMLRTVGVGASRAPVMLRSLEAGHPLTDVEEEDTLASALSGGIGSPNRWTFPMLGEAVRRHVFLPLEAPERSILRGVRYAFQHLKTVLEGGGATALGALLPAEGGPARLPDRLLDRNGPLVIVLSGGNLAPDRLLELMNSTDCPAG